MYPDGYELVFEDPDVKDAIVVLRTDRTGAGGAPVYEDETGIVRAEINDQGEIRMLASGGQQSHDAPSEVRPLRT
ncbi:DUF6296 family protein [Streptomyces sp. NPDC007088]|uniref:DUF6296 family protein n=1 Tax=Streptomyces sp. NPDC007088 TaxID=3364773 RepID=UPI0036B96020